MKAWKAYFILRFMQGANTLSPVPLAYLSPDKNVRHIIKANPIMAAISIVLTSPGGLSDPYLGDDGNWYWPDGTPFPDFNQEDTTCP
jgi:hypothetical protein